MLEQAVITGSRGTAGDPGLGEPAAGPLSWDQYAGASDNPVFVLCTSRSGSTLLRFLLDAHPELACPPELTLPGLCAHLVRVWSQIAADGPAGADAAAAGVRHTADLMLGPYLAQRRKKRFCNKDLGAEQHADALLGVFPEAKFICLYRHPMDVIASGIEACPWGLNGYGFEPYTAGSPANAVHALASYWADHVAGILDVQDRFPGQCHPVRYEDMVADPDTVAAQTFDFLGAAPVGDISARAFSLERERSGPGDYKIWTTAGITPQSAGRGWSIPAALIGGPVRDKLRSLTDRLGYVAVDDNWGGPARPADLRLPDSGPAQPAPAPLATGPAPAGARLLGRRLRQGVARLDPGFAQRWPAHAGERFALAALSPGGSGKDSWWQADLAARHVRSATPVLAARTDWTITAPAQAWEEVIRHNTNLGVAFRRLGMRYTSSHDAPGSTAADTRAAMMSELLGASTWQTTARHA